MSTEPVNAVGLAERASYIREMLSMGVPANADGIPIMVMEFLKMFAETLRGAVARGSDKPTPEIETAPNGARFESFRDGVSYRLLVIHEQRLGKDAMTDEVAREYDRLVALYGLPDSVIGRQGSD